MRDFDLRKTMHGTVLGIAVLAVTDDWCASLLTLFFRAAGFGHISKRTPVHNELKINSL